VTKARSKLSENSRLRGSAPTRTECSVAPLPASSTDTQFEIESTVHSSAVFGSGTTDVRPGPVGISISLVSVAASKITTREPGWLMAITRVPSELTAIGRTGLVSSGA
jgi:hypothetical protein